MILSYSKIASQQVVSRLVGPPSRVRLLFNISYSRISDPLATGHPTRLNTHTRNYLMYWPNLSS